jgi:hypothetical protein
MVVWPGSVFAASTAATRADVVHPSGIADAPGAKDTPTPNEQPSAATATVARLAADNLGGT